EPRSRGGGDGGRKINKGGGRAKRRGPPPPAASMVGTAQARLCPPTKLRRPTVRNQHMQMNDSQRIPASKEKVWAALNDPAVLKQCIPGCQSLEMSATNEMTATVVLKIGPVK